MGRHNIDQAATTTAPPSTVYALLRDGSTWPRWSPIGAFSLTRAGADEPEGLGALRLFTTGRTRSCEEIVELVENRRLSYELRSGLPLIGYRANVDLEPTAGGGTTIHWRSSFDAKIPGTGWFYRMFLGAFIGRCVRGLAAYAPSRPRGRGAASRLKPHPRPHRIAPPETVKPRSPPPLKRAFDLYPAQTRAQMNASHKGRG
jgi:uncharacterized protein YndB with AHSA1/START domain